MAGLLDHLCVCVCAVVNILFFRAAPVAYGGVQLELQLLAYATATATATQDPSLVWDP